MSEAVAAKIIWYYRKHCENEFDRVERDTCTVLENNSLYETECAMSCQRRQ